VREEGTSLKKLMQLSKKKKGGTQPDPIHSNFLAPLKFMAGGVLG